MRWLRKLPEAVRSSRFQARPSFPPGVMNEVLVTEFRQFAPIAVPTAFAGPICGVRHCPKICGAPSGQVVTLAPPGSTGTLRSTNTPIVHGVVGYQAAWRFGALTF